MKSSEALIRTMTAVLNTQHSFQRESTRMPYKAPGSTPRQVQGYLDRAIDKRLRKQAKRLQDMK